MNFLDLLRKLLKIMQEQPPDALSAIIPHESMDLDAFASAILLKTILLCVKPSLQLVIYDTGLNRETKLFAEKLLPNLKTLLKSPTRPDKLHLIILVDTSNPLRYTQEELKKKIAHAKHIIAIDHHKTQTSIPRIYLPYSSTVEIILQIAETINCFDIIKASPTLTKLAVAGILTDTKYLTSISPKTFYYLNKLLENQHEHYREVMQTLKLIKNERTDISLRLALLKAMQRIIIIRNQEKIITITHVSNYEAKVANTLINLGADVAIVASRKKTKRTPRIHLSIRSAEEIDINPLVKQILQHYPSAIYGTIGTNVAGITIPTSEKLENHIKKIRIIAEDFIKKL